MGSTVCGCAGPPHSAQLCPPHACVHRLLLTAVRECCPVHALHSVHWWVLDSPASLLSLVSDALNAEQENRQRPLMAVQIAGVVVACICCPTLHIQALLPLHGATSKAYILMQPRPCLIAGRFPGGWRARACSWWRRWRQAHPSRMSIQATVLLACCCGCKGDQVLGTLRNLHIFSHGTMAWHSSIKSGPFDLTRG